MKKPVVGYVAGSDRAEGTAHGPCGRDHLGGGRQRGREVGDHEIVLASGWPRAPRSSAQRSRWRSPRGLSACGIPPSAPARRPTTSRAPRCSSICSRAWCSATRRGSPGSCAVSAAPPICRSALVVAALRAQGIWFQLLAIAEQNRDMRNRREAERERGYEQLKGTFAGVFAAAAAEGITGVEIRGALSSLRVRPVITAHPTEAKRVTVMERHRRIYLKLLELESPRWTDRERGRVDPGARRRDRAPLAHGGAQARETHRRARGGLGDLFLQ